MMINLQLERWERRDRVLLAALDPQAFGPLAVELQRRGADIVNASDIEEIAEVVRSGGLDAVYLAPRDSLDATLLLVRLVMGVAKGVRVMLVVKPVDAPRYTHVFALVEEAMTFALSPRRMADAAGIGFQRLAASA